MGGAARAAQNQSRAGWAALLTGGFMVAEAVGGVLSGSLALIADAGHMLTDAASLALAWLAFWMPRRPRRPAAHLRVPSLPGAGRLQQRPDAVLHRAAVVLRGDASPARADRGARRAYAGDGRRWASLVNIAAFLRAAWRGARQPQHQGRDAARDGRHAGLGGGDRCGARHPVDRLDADRSAAVGAGGLLILRSAWFLVRESGHILLEGAPDISTSTRSAQTGGGHSGRREHASRARLVAHPGQAHDHPARQDRRRARAATASPPPSRRCCTSAMAWTTPPSRSSATPAPTRIARARAGAGRGRTLALARQDSLSP